MWLSFAEKEFEPEFEIALSGGPFRFVPSFNCWVLGSNGVDDGGSLAPGSLATPPTSISTTNPASYIGTEQLSSGNNINGYIDNVRIYSRALSAAEVTALYNFDNSACAEGDIMYNSGSSVLQYCDGAGWNKIPYGH